MTYNNDEQQSTNITNPVNTGFNKSKAIGFVRGLRNIAKDSGNFDAYKELDLDRMSREYAEAKQEITKSFKKTVTGASAATGSALVNVQYQPFSLDSIAEVKGGIFRESGVLTATGNANSFVYPTAGPMGDLVDTTPGSGLNNDITSGNPFINLPITVHGMAGEVRINNDPVAQGYVGNLGQLLAVFEQILEIKKLQAEDSKMLFNGSNGITDNPANITVEILPSTGQFPVQRAVKSLASKLRKYNAGSPVVYMNQTGLEIVLNEQDTVGNFGETNREEVGMFRPSVPGVLPDAGRAGTIAYSKTFVVPKIKDTYTINSSGVVTGQTGGTYTIIAVGVPKHAAVAISRPEMDTTATFTPANNYEAFNVDQTIVASRVGVGAGLINPYTWGYIAVPV